MIDRTLTYEEFKANVLDTFIDSYKLGREYGKKIFGKRKINVVEVEPLDELGHRTDGEIELKRITDGRIHNIGGRSIPF